MRFWSGHYSGSGNVISFFPPAVHHSGACTPACIERLSARSTPPRRQDRQRQSFMSVRRIGYAVPFA
jgi:hypothetical protein